MVELSTTNFVKQYRPDKHSRVEIKNGRILDVTNGCYCDAGTSIIMRGGVIESMPGLTGKPNAAKPDFTIDLQGKTVMPGLFNTHCHLSTVGATMLPDLADLRTNKYQKQQLAKNMTDCLAHGVTHIRDAWYPSLEPNRTLRQQIAKGELPGPRILQAVAVGPSGSYLQEKLSLPLKVFGIAQVDPSQEDSGSVSFPIDATEKQVRDAVDIAIDERRADVIKVGDQKASMLTNNPVPVMNIEQLSALADQARRRGVQSMMHHSTVESFRRGVKAGIYALEHAPMDALLTAEDIDAFKAAGCHFDPTVSAFYAIFSWKMAGNGSKDHPQLTRLTAFRDRNYTYATIAEEYYIPELRTSVMNGYKKCVAGKPKMMGVIDMSGMFAWTKKTATFFKNLCLLYKHGIPMTTGNDTMPPCTPAMVGLDLQMLDHVLKGDADGTPLSGVEAARIATINSARSLGLEQAFGTIEIGKTADLVILDGDPLEDFRLIGSRVAALFMDGRLVINNCGLEVESSEKAQS